MTKKEKAQIIKSIVIVKEKIDTALYKNANGISDFEEMMNEVNSASTKLNQAIEAYDRIKEEDLEK